MATHSNADTNYKLQYLVDDMFQSYEFNDDEKWVIPVDGLHLIVDTYIVKHCDEDEIISIVNGYGVFKAIKVYQDNYGDFNLDDLSFNHTYGTLVYTIIDEYINNNDIVVESPDTTAEDYVFRRIDMSGRIVSDTVSDTDSD